IGMAFSTHSLVVLETAPSGQEGGASAALQLANVLGVALGTGLGGVIISATSAGGGPQAGIVIQSVLMIGVTALGMVAALRLPWRRAAAPAAAPMAPASEGGGVAQA